MDKKFTITVKSEKQALKFNLVLVFTHTGSRYLVTVLKDLKSYLFYMEQKNGNWQINHPINYPSWILENEENLKQGILEQQE
jgi:RNA-splicing ligase RtcB